MPDIDLTEAVTAAAEAYWVTARERSKNGDDYVLPPWGDLDQVVQHDTREFVLPIVTAAHRDIAQQAWKQGYSAGDADTYHGGAYGRQPNPYDPTVTTEDGGPLGD